jgi:hypothetical protein
LIEECKTTRSFRQEVVFERNAGVVKMSVKYKNYPIKIDALSLAETVLSAPFGGFNPFGRSNSALNYEAAVTAVLDTLNSHPGVGQKVLAAPPKGKTIIIIPFTEKGCNAHAPDQLITVDKNETRIRFSPTTWKVGGMCNPGNPAGIGTNPDEVLLHELLHTYRKLRGTETRALFNKPDKAYGTIEELWAILLTNIYMSEKGATKFRKDHSGFSELPAKWATSESFLNDPDFSVWIDFFWATESVLLTDIATTSIAAFNPLKPYKAKKDAKRLR